MKVFISVDIEGIAGIAHWDEALKGGTTKNGPEYEQFRTLMTDEAIAACKGAEAAGATEIYLRDAHESGRNLDISRIPSGVTLIRGWSGHPYKMIQEVDDSFDAMVMIGWHGAARDGGNPLSHTMTDTYADITLNGAPMSEFGINVLIAATHRVPVVFLSGDAAICAEARVANPAITTVETKRGHGASIILLTPCDACARIEAGVAQALRSDLSVHALPAYDLYRMDLRFSAHELAYRRAFYPGARLIADDTICVEADEIFDIARALLFM